MTAALDFEYEVFISYAHLDNEPLFPDEKGWVSQFDELLSNLLGVCLGEDPKIWRDHMLRGNDLITGAILGQLPRIAVMVSVLSPRYPRSEWCVRELNEFRKVAEATGGYVIGTKSRIYKVVKYPIKSRSDEPEILRDIKGYEFFFLKDGGNPQTYHAAAYDPAGRKKFLDIVGDVAFDIASLLQIVRERMAAPGSGGAAEPETESAGREVTVYIAEPTPDLVQERDAIKRDLLQRRYRVLPDQPLPSSRAEFLAMARVDIQQSDISLHLVGREYGECPENDRTSYAHWETRVAAERDGEPSFSRLVWMPKDNKPEDVRQRRLVNELLNESISGNTDLLQTTIEDFKTIIEDKIQSLRAASPPEPPPDGSDAPRIYVICDREDRDAAEPFSQYLETIGCRYEFPIFEGTEAKLRAGHGEKLRRCDGAILFWSTAPKLWLLTKLDDLQKINGYGRTWPLRAQAVYVTGERTPEKMRFGARNAFVFRNFGETSLSALEILLRPFVAKLEGEGEDKAI